MCAPKTPDPAALTEFLRASLALVLAPEAQLRLDQDRSEIQAGAGLDRFAQRAAGAARFTRGIDLRPGPAALAQAQRLCPGWNPERWSARDAWRALLILALPDLAGAGGQALFETWLDSADEGELVAGMRCLCLLPRGERFLSRAEEGCRSNMRSVFEATACDTPYPHDRFGEIAWKQALLKSVFVGAPTWRIQGLDGRLSEDLARMALDYVEERRSAGREVPIGLWSLLGAHGGSRAGLAIESLAGSERIGERLAALLCFARRGDGRALAGLLAGERDQDLRQAMLHLTHGPVPAAAFGAIPDLERRFQRV
jgi:hypothetical protein